MTMINSAASPDRPQFKILSAEKIDKIHAATLEVLAQTGVRIRLPEAVELLADAGCEVAGREIVKIPARVIEECLDMAPDTIRVYDRNGAAALELGGRFHRQRIRLISSQVSTVTPALSARWSKQRRFALAWDMIRRIRPSRFITHQIPFRRARQAFELIDKDPASTIQVILEYDHH